MCDSSCAEGCAKLDPEPKETSKLLGWRPSLLGWRPSLVQHALQHARTLLAREVQLAAQGAMSKVADIGDERTARMPRQTGGVGVPSPQSESPSLPPHLDQSDPYDLKGHSVSV